MPNQFAAPSLPQDEPFKQVWDTAYLKPRDRFDYFRDGVCRTFFAFSPERPDGRELMARMERQAVPQGAIAKVDVTPHRVVRTPADRASIPIDYMSLSIQGGDIDLVAGGKQFMFTRGEISLIHGNEISECRLGKNDNFQMISLVFNKAILGDVRLADPVTAIPDDYSWAPLRSCLKLIADRFDAASLQESTYLSDACIALLKAALLQDRDYLDEALQRDPSATNGMTRMLKRTIQLEAQNPDLSLSAMATRFGVSSRYIQKLFSRDGTTFRVYVVGVRLNNVRNDLLDPTKAHIALSDIAYRWGFRDMTTFHRNFKEYFGETPRAMRNFGLQ